MRKRLLLILSFIAAVFASQNKAQAQEEYVWGKDAFTTEIAVEDPVYMPIMGFGAGFMQYQGSLKNTSSNPMYGTLAYKFHIKAVYLDHKHRFSINLPIIFGANMTVNQHSTTNSKNLNFQAAFTSIGTTLEYSFGNFYAKDAIKRIRPYISLGIAWMPQMTVSTDLVDKNGKTYNYWSDGTIRDMPQAGQSSGVLLQRDYKYETSIGKSMSLGVPVEAGLDFNISERMYMRVGLSYTQCFITKIDDVSKHQNISGYNDLSKGLKNYGYTFTYASLHYDLFSDPKTLKMEKYLIDIDDYDYAFFDDEDKDNVADGIDQCPNTPPGVEVDSVGCPFDADKDGVPDYRDKEPNTLAGAIVDADGVEVKDSAVWANLNQESMAHSQVEVYLRNASSSRGERRAKVPIPEKFKKLDLDNDGYISFEEVLKAIDTFFDFSSDLSTADIYELNNFFFDQ
jgi:opacity protein-like surface antigen